LEKCYVLQKRELVLFFAFATKYNGLLFKKDENQNKDNNNNNNNNNGFL